MDPAWRVGFSCLEGIASVGPSLHLMFRVRGMNDEGRRGGLGSSQGTRKAGGQKETEEMIG